MLISLSGCLTEMVIQISSSFLVYGRARVSISMVSCFFYVSNVYAPVLSADGKHPACDKSYFERREFSYTLKEDMYIRFQSFNSVSELENSIREKCPFKIDIGPVYSVDVRFHSILFLLCSL